MTTTIVTNNKERPLLSWYDLTPKEQKTLDYIDSQEAQESFNGFRYKGNVYDLGEFMRVPANSDIAGWHGYSSHTYFSGVLVKYSRDYEYVIVGRYYS